MGGDRQNKDWRAQDWSASESLGNLGPGLSPEDSGAFSESTLGLWEVCLGKVSCLQTAFELPGF